MGVRVPHRSRIILEFADDSGLEEMSGARVVCRSMSINESEKLVASLERNDDEIRALADSILLEWNLEDEHGDTLPITRDTLRSFDPWVPDLLMRKWIEGLRTPPLASLKPSENGSAPTR